MSFIVSNTGKQSGDFTPHPPGVFAGRCTRIIDLGTQKSTYKGQPSQKHKMTLGFETEAKIESGPMEGKPYLITQRYTVTLSEKGVLLRDLESWRGRKFTKAELHAFDLKNLLGKACMLNIVHAEGSSGVVYANIAGIMPLPPSMIAPPAVDTVFFSLSDFDQEVYDSLPARLQETIASSPEYQALKAPKPTSSKPTASKPPAAPAGSGAFEDMADDIPF